MELEFFVGIEACGDNLLEPGKDPPIDEGEGFRRGRICRVVVVEIRQKDAQGVANASVGIRETPPAADFEIFLRVSTSITNPCVSTAR